MKATVWTNYINCKEQPDYKKARPRCIFKGDIEILPRIGDGIVVRKGFCVERVKDVYIDIIDNSVEIHLITSDSNFEYGESLI